MKYTYLLIVLLLTSCSALQNLTSTKASSHSISKKIIGNWVANDINDTRGEVHFTKDLTFSIESDSGETFEGTYEIVSTESPAKVNFNFNDEGLEQMKGLVELVSAKNLKLTLNIDDVSRPEDFEDNETLWLRRN